MKAFVLILLGLTATGCAPDPGTAPASPSAPSESAPVETRTLWLTAATDGVELHFHRAPDREGPRQMELFVRYDGLTYRGAEALGSATAAGKRLIVQDQGDQLRVILLGAQSVHALESGPLARLRFAGQGTLSLQPQPTIFAPPPANQGVVLGAPLTLGGR